MVMVMVMVMGMILSKIIIINPIHITWTIYITNPMLLRHSNARCVTKYDIIIQL